jgi:hypothetical protein
MAEAELALQNITIETWNQPDTARINRFLGRKAAELDFDSWDEEADEDIAA